MNRLGPGAQTLILFAVALLVIFLVAGCKSTVVCVWKETGRTVADRLCSTGNPDYEWRKAS